MGDNNNENNNEEVLVPTKAKTKSAAKPKAAAAGSATKKSRNPYTAAERVEAAKQVLNVKLAGKKVLGKHVTELSRAIGTSRNEATLRRIINSMEKKDAAKANKAAAKPVKTVKAASASKKATKAVAAPRASAAASLLAPASIVPSKKELATLTAAIGTANEAKVLNAIVAAAPNNKGTKKAKREADKAEFERFKREAHADLLAAANGAEPAVSNVERLAAIRMSGSTLSVANYMTVKKAATARKGRKGAKASLATANFHPAAMDPCDQCRMKLMLMNDPAERRAAIRKLRDGMAKNDLGGRPFVYNNEAVARRESNRENRSASRRARRAALKAAARRVSQSPLRPYRGTRKAFRFQTEGTGY